MNMKKLEPFDILLVEDDAADANLVRNALKENGILCRLHHVLDGLEALEYLKRDGKMDCEVPRPDLILLDINMPQMNGRKLLQVLKSDAQLSGIPVVMLTTSDVESDVIDSYKLGASGFITKPVDIEQFIEAVRQLENYWFALTRLPEKI